LRAHPSAGFARSVETAPLRAETRHRDAERLGPREALPASDTRWVTAVAAAALAFTALVLVVPSMTFAYPLPFAAAFVACMASVTAMVVAVLFFKRHCRSSRPVDLLIALALSVTACLEAVMPLVGQVDPWTATIALESRAAGRGVVAILFCLAAWLPSRPMHQRWPDTRFTAAVLGGVVLVVSAGFWGAEQLPRAIPGGLAAAGGDTLARDPWVLGTRLAGVVLLAVSAVGFSRKASDEGDGLFTWVAMGAVLLCVACFHDFIFPSLHSDWLTTADLMRLVAQEVVMVGVLFEMGVWWRRRASDAAERERRRMARDLHDGLAQELAFLSTQSMLVGRSGMADAGSLRPLIAAAERALQETRTAIGDLSDSGDRRLDRALTSTGRDIADRYGCEIAFDLAELETDGRTSRELTKLAGEAMLNAARHASPHRVDVELRCARGVVSLSIADDGPGIDWEVPSAGFGLISMQERAARLGGECVIESSTGGGTVVRVEVPIP
jgi:signal transduction histidine kinase